MLEGNTGLLQPQPGSASEIILSKNYLGGERPRPHRGSIPFTPISSNIYSDQDVLPLSCIPCAFEFLIFLWELLCVSLLPNLTIVYMAIRQRYFIPH